MTLTKSIPRNLPIFVSEADHRTIRNWMAARPEAPEIDGCLNQRARWEYRVVDQGVWTDVRVLDRGIPAELILEHNVEEF